MIIAYIDYRVDNNTFLGYHEYLYAIVSNSSKK